MAAHDRVCSLKRVDVGTVDPEEWTTVRFGTTESSDSHDMHAVTDTGKRESALIVPRDTAWGRVDVFAVWREVNNLSARDRPTAWKLRLCRDPYGKPDTTITNAMPAVPDWIKNEQSRSWGLWVFPTVPLALQVWHNARKPMWLECAEFKLSYQV